MVTAKPEKRSHLSQKCWSKRFDHHARLVGFGLGNRVGAARGLGTAGRSTTRGCVADYVEQGAQYAGDLRSDSRRHQLDPLREMLGD
jgi:hypothetical protein